MSNEILIIADFDGTLMLKILRKLAERLSRDRWLWRRLPNGARIAISPDAQLKYLGGSFDRDLVALARDAVWEGATVWDIGANCGTFAFSCDKAGQVLAVEADPFLAGLLNRSAAKSTGRIKVLESAVSDRVGWAEFSIATRGRASNHLSLVPGYTQTGGERKRINVRTVTLDAILDISGAPDIVKIDIEGAELLALRGGRRLLLEVRPTIYLEATSDTAAELRQILNDANYCIEDRGNNWLAVPEEFDQVTDTLAE